MGIGGKIVLAVAVFITAATTSTRLKPIDGTFIQWQCRSYFLCTLWLWFCNQATQSNQSTDWIITARLCAAAKAYPSNKTQL